MDNSVEKVVQIVQSTPRYRSISTEMARRIAVLELAKGRSLQEAVKAVRSKLHQVGAAYQEQPIDYISARAELDTLPTELADPRLQDFCCRMMAKHASTRERMPFISDLYAQILIPYAPIHSLLDLACGLNPLALPWMHLAPDAIYSACDIYTDMVDFLNQFFRHIGVDGKANVCDLVVKTSGNATLPHAQVALLLKALPCLEQLDKTITPSLLSAIHADVLIVSFPGRSLGGKNKGMPAFYESRFNQIIPSTGWHIQQRIEFKTELVFVLTA